MSIKNLFLMKPELESHQIPLSQAVTDALTADNPSKKGTEETYNMYGRRMSGLVNASLQALVPFLNKIFTQERSAQSKDENKQNELKTRIKNQIIGLETELKQQEVKLEDVHEKRENTKDEISGLNDEINELKTETSSVDKEAMAKMLLGILILILLTIYLFIFYSSTFYSAFFPQNVETIVLSTAMFNGAAIIEAWQNLTQGKGIEFLFIILAPVIFLALGFVVHFVSKKEGIIAKLKAVALYLITLLFDCVLAYKIGEMLYEQQGLMQLEAQAPYSISLAIKDPNTWAVILCGFIAYIIWGLVFDLSYTGFEDFNSNKGKISALKAKIEKKKSKLDDLLNEETSIKSKITELKGQISQKQNLLNTRFIVDNDKIKACLNEFFAGWISMMPALGKSPQQQQEAQVIYDNTIKQLIP